MPIRLPKGFSRRKSSGDVLEETISAPSFRVLSRDEILQQKDSQNTRSGENSGAHFSSTLQKWRYAEEEEEEEQLNNSSNSSGNLSRSSALYNTSSSSARLSSSSTLPSSADVEPSDQSSLWKRRWRNKTFDDSHLSAANTFSNQTMTQPLDTAQPTDYPPKPRIKSGWRPWGKISSENRSNSMAELPTLGTDIAVGSSDLGDIFDDIGKRTSGYLGSPKKTSADLVLPKHGHPHVLPPRPQTSPKPSLTPSPGALEFPREYGVSPRSLNSQRSDNMLISHTEPGKSANSSPTLLDRHRHGSTNKLLGEETKSGVNGYSSPAVDEDALFIRQSLRNSRNSQLISSKTHSKNEYSSVSPQHQAKRMDRDSSPDTPDFRSSTKTTIRNRSVSTQSFDNGSGHDIERPFEFAGPQSSVHPRRSFIRSNTEPASDREVSGTYINAHKGSSIETEVVQLGHQRQTSREQRKKEANMIIYRQQMEKIGGGRSTIVPTMERPDIRHSSLSTPDLFNRLSYNGLSKESTHENDDHDNEDEDDDYEVPLAVLQQHGFPSRGRPPTKPIGSASSFVLRPPSPTIKPQSRNSSTPPTERRQSHLPPFAKNLPQDPYPNTLTQHSANYSPYARRSIPSHPSRTGNTLPGLPPGGLVSVIADEERAKASRRGTPSAYGSYGQATPKLGQMNYMAGDSNATMNAGMQQQQNSEILVQQLSQNMLMLQAQMQQVLLSQVNHNQPPQMQSGVVNPQQQASYMQNGPQGQQFLSTGRPASFVGSAWDQPSQIGAPSVNGDFLRVPGARASVAVSQFTPSVPSINTHNNNYNPAVNVSSYAASIAPSERSNIGLSARYRPVSHHFGTPSATSPSTSPVANLDENRQSARNDRASLSTTPTKSRSPSAKPSTIRAVERVKVSGRKGDGNGSGTGDSDSDSEGWASMKKKRQLRVHQRMSLR